MAAYRWCGNGCPPSDRLALCEETRKGHAKSAPGAEKVTVVVPDVWPTGMITPVHGLAEMVPVTVWPTAGATVSSKTATGATRR